MIYEDQWRKVSLTVPTVPLVLPPGLEIVEQDAYRLVYRPVDQVLGPADVLAGSVPLLHLQADGLGVAYLDVPPPSPLTLSDLREMWDVVADLNLPTPSALPAQGRLLPGAVTPAATLLPEALDRAHAAARQLVAVWPLQEDESRIWRALELPGGREDLAGTDRRAARLPAQIDLRGRSLPIRSLRRVRRDRLWTSHELNRTANVLAELTAELVQGAEQRARAALLQPFYRVAELARSPVPTLDPPLSTWPVSALGCLREFRAALALVDATRSPEGAMRAPLCHLWRLYESWIAATCFKILDSDSRLTRTHDPDIVDGAQWFASWSSAEGFRVILFTQPEIGQNLQDFSGILPEGLRSTSSGLRPDVLICVVTPEERTGILVLDAKRRSALSMDSRDAAEAASKYVWGIRVGGSASDPDAGSAHVTAVLLATTAVPPLMYSAQARITVIQVLPNRPETELREAISQSLVRATVNART